VPFSHATAVEGWLFVTGQVPTDSRDNSAPLPEGIEAQTSRVVENLKLVLAGAGSALDQVVFAHVYLTEFERECAAMNRVYEAYFTPESCRRGPMLGLPRSLAGHSSKSTSSRAGDSANRRSCGSAQRTRWDSVWYASCLPLPHNR
jgi:enamine deaminase RidA (YjgF/YER057c/UK114 family)